MLRKSFARRIEEIEESVAPTGELILRLALGATFLAHGRQKLKDPSTFAGFLRQLGVPAPPDIVRNFSELSVFIAAGMRDTIVPRDQTEQLAAILESGGADVSLFWHQGGHELGDDDVAAAKKWLSEDVMTRLAA